MRSALIARRALALLLLGVGLAGCGNSSAPSVREQPAAVVPQRNTMNSKLQAMSPEERATYLKQHQDEVRAAYSQVPGGSPTAPATPGN